MGRALSAFGVSIVLIPLLLSPGAVSASTDITYLGKATSSIPSPPYGLLDVFQRRGPVLRQGSKPELLFLGTMVDDGSAVERWAVVKALDRFGTLTGVAPAETRQCTQSNTQTNSQCVPLVEHGYATGAATFDLEGAHYRSSYLALVSADAIDVNGRVARLSVVETNLFRRYVSNAPRLSTNASLAAKIWSTSAAIEGRRQFPLISVGGYLQTYVGVALPSDLQGTNEVFLPFDTIQQTLQNGRPSGTVPRSNGGQTAGQVPSSLVPDINAEANVITALICHADGKKPGSVCGRSVIKQILKHVK